jgi:tetratricopeptide (TPR) repeat protein
VARRAELGTIPPVLRMPAAGAVTKSGATPAAVPAAVDKGRSRALLALGLAALLVAAGFGVLWVRARATPAPQQRSAADELTRELARKQLQLAQRELENKSYGSAIAEAQGVLKLAAGNAEARAVVATAQARLDELARSAAEARRLIDAKDNDAASRELQKVLELDPHYPPAADLQARLDSAFKAQAEQAAAAMRAARDTARTAGATDDALRTADQTTRKGDEQMGRGEFAQAAASYLAARDDFEQARSAAATAQGPPAGGPLARGRAAGTAAVVPSLPQPTPPPARGFTMEPTRIDSPRGSGPAGFDGAEMSGRAPQFSGRMEFEVLPPAVRPGDAFVVRILLRNDGRKPVKVRTLSLAAVVNGLRAPAAATPLLKEVQSQSRGLVAEYSGVWSGAREWALEAVVTSDKDEQVASRLKAN